jgi:hypothetical protein
MLNDLTFKNVCKFLKKDDGALIDKVDKLSGVAILFSPLVLGPQAASALGLLGAKNELTKLSKSLLESLTSKKESNYLARMERMQIAYGLICITAFFEALDELMPDELRKKIALLPQEKMYLAEKSGKLSARYEEERNTSKILKDGVLDIPLLFPHPVISFEEQLSSLNQMYKEMSICLDSFIKKLAVWEEADEESAACIQQTIKELPEKSLQCFEGQYLELARKYNDFYIWSRFHEYKTTQGQINKISDYLNKYSSLLTENNTRIDIGFDKLQETVLSLPDLFKEIEARDVVSGLQRFYEARINEPIIEDEHAPDDNKPSLNFPKISEAFIPQSYRVLVKSKKDSHLEREDTWQKIEQKYDLGSFLLSYLSSPYSIETPLLILGHPGSGKSLLTKVLSAKLMSNAYTPIRVPLREVNADLPIEEQAETIIKRTTGNKLSSWAHFSGQFSDRPLVIILDGYDELLQASGKVYTGYLKEVQQFQKREIEQGRPVRVIVTSRITLIDKTSIPEDSTVLRLLEFNEEQRNEWIRVWNDANKDYFNSCNPPIEPFTIPVDENKDKTDKILSLAEQPLLLLMLALYDSDENRLRQHKGIDRTVLYDSLLRRFVERERRRYIKDFDQIGQVQRDKEIDKEMLRLGAVAIGMYNRKQLYVLSSELTTDLEFFKLERQITVESGRQMTQADLLLGSFFFIHKSKAGQQNEGELHAENDTAFEFLHNTFGEFLTAAFILKFAFQETEALYSLSQNESLQSEFQRKINNPDGLADEWFACLMYSPLYSRPVILEMLREWTSHLLERKRRSRDEFLSSLDEIIKSQISILIQARNLPSMLRNDGQKFMDISLLGHIAIYTLNLIILRTILDKNEFVFDESYYTSSEDIGDLDTSGTRAWDKLTYIWRSWFSLDNLNGLTAILSAKRDNTKVILNGYKSFQIRPSVGRLETVLNVAMTLADDITGGLSGIFAPDSENYWQHLRETEKRLEREGIDLKFEFIVRRLRLSISGKDGRPGNLNQLISEGFHEAIGRRRHSALVVDFLSLVSKAFHLNRLSIDHKIEIREWFVHPGHLTEIMENYPREAIEWLRLAREFGDKEWFERFGEEFLDRTIHSYRFQEMIEMNPEVAIEWLRLTRGISDKRRFERFSEEFFERTVHSYVFRQEIEMRPEVALELIRLARELGKTRWIEQFGEEFFERTVHSYHFRQEIEMRPEVALELIRLARELGKTHWVERYHSKFFRRGIRSDFGQIPLSYIQDIKWYAEVVNDADLLMILQSYF